LIVVSAESFCSAWCSPPPPQPPPPPPPCPPHRLNGIYIKPEPPPPPSTPRLLNIFALKLSHFPPPPPPPACPFLTCVSPPPPPPPRARPPPRVPFRPRTLEYSDPPPPTPIINVESEAHISINNTAPPPPHFLGTVAPTLLTAQQGEGLGEIAWNCLVGVSSPSLCFIRFFVVFWVGWGGVMWVFSAPRFVL